jgi:hypothetical protein
MRNLMTKIILLLLLLFLCTGCCTKQQSIVVTGKITKDKDNFFVVTDCSTHKKYKIGLLASNPYFLLAKTYDSLILNGPIIASISGKLSKDKNTINFPTVMDIKNDKCKNLISGQKI